MTLRVISEFDVLNNVISLNIGIRYSSSFSSRSFTAIFHLMRDSSTIRAGSFAIFCSLKTFLTSSVEFIRLCLVSLEEILMPHRWCTSVQIPRSNCDILWHMRIDLFSFCIELGRYFTSLSSLLKSFLLLILIGRYILTD